MQKKRRLQSQNVSGAVPQLYELDRQLQNEDLVEWNKAFHKYSDISKWLDRLEKSHPALVQVVVVGKTHEGRDIKAAKITWLAAPSSTPKLKIFMDGCVHAREWISSAVVQFLITRLIRGFEDKDEAIKSLLLNMEWYLVPVLNVDGYMYSWEHNRMQRKNRQVLVVFCFSEYNTK